MKVIPYKKEHAYIILSSNIVEGGNLEPDFEKYAEIWESGPAYTLVIDNHIIFCGGVVDIKGNRGEAWMLASSLFFKYPKTCYKVCKETLDNIIDKHGFRRVQATVFPEAKKAVRFVTHLGFDKEGVLSAYGPKNRDIIMFARIQ